MSWAEEDWTVGLSGRVLQKVKELQVHQERLSRENKQKQLQLDNLHTSLKKQTAKYEEIRGELQYQQRDLRDVQRECKAAVTSNERLAQDLQTKQSQVCSLEGQVAATRTLNNKLTLEIKRLEAELEKLQNSSRSADTTPLSSPGWNTTLPWEHNVSRKEERPGYRDDGQSRGFHIRRLPFSEEALNSLPRPQHKSTPQRHASGQSDVFSTPSAVFPWEQDDSRPAARRLSPSSPQTPCTDIISQGQSEKSVCEDEKDQKTATDTSLADAGRRVTALEAELCAKAGALKSIQSEMVQSKTELAAKELGLQKARHELSMAHTRVAQESERASGAEQRLKHLLEELKCQRQNAESSRLQHQQRWKELEKQHQRDVTELQRERQCLEKQHQQEVNKLNVELQQARTLHNALQAQADKLSIQKQELNKELDTLKEKLKWTQGQLQESQKKEAQTQAKLTEALREAEGVAVTLEQSRKRERALEEVGRTLAEERVDALRLIKELQEQKAVPAAPLQPVQLCPVGKSFSPQPSYSPASQPSPHVKRSSVTALPEQKGEEDVDVDKRRTEMAASYPSDREPGEGSEHVTDRIAPESESLPRGGHGSNEAVDRSGNEGTDGDTSGTNKHSTLDQVLSTSSRSAASTPTNRSVVCDRCEASDDLKRENAALRSELHDSREELQKRLQDLEAQRRAETEARTRLKQLGRKCSSAAVEKTEQDKEWRAQLEAERAETEKLRKAMAALQAEITRGREERDKRESEEQNNALENRESEMIELNIQMKQQLAEIKAQLALEKEERKRAEEERNKVTATDIDVKKEQSTKLEDLKAELKQLKSRREECSLGEEKRPFADSPLTYFDLRGDELNSNVVRCDNKLLPSPERHLLFCQSTNQRNMLVSQATADLVQDPELPSPSDDGQTGVITSDRQNYVGGSPLPHLQKVEPASADLAKEVLRLQNEKTKEAERAHQYQVKLEGLQSQVTRQTKQLTMAFEKQSQHISGLLVELQGQESAFLVQGEELQRYKQELAAFKANKEAEERKREEEMMIKEVEDGEQKEVTQYEITLHIPGLQSMQEKESPVPVLTANSLEDSGYDAQRSQLEIVTADAEIPEPFSNESDVEALRTGDRRPASQDRTLSNHSSAEDAASADMDAELLALRQEIRLLKQLVGGVAPSGPSAPGTPALHTDSGKQEDSVEQSHNTGSAALSCSAERSSQSVPDNIGTDARQPLPQDVGRMKDEGDLAMENWRTTKAEEELESVPELQIKRLQQQVEELQRSLRSLSEETELQAEELVRWRLSAQPAPDNQNETRDQIPAVTQPQWNQWPAAEKNRRRAQTAEESFGIVSVVREDELFVSCSSGTLQGRLLSSRLQNSKLPEEKTLNPSEKTFQECDQIVQESEKENHEFSVLHQLNTCQTLQEKRDTEVIQMLSEKAGQPHATKDSIKVSRPKQSKLAECSTGSPESVSDAPRAPDDHKPTRDSSDKDVRTEMRSVGSQTEESLSPRRAPTTSDLRCAYTQTEENEQEDLVDPPPVSAAASLGGAELRDVFLGSFPIPADPARLAERIRRNRTQLSAAFDDTEYEPYGLPDVVMKGFADIPSGPSCPYIVRRGLLGTTVVPVAPKDQRHEEETD
ncbi:uncharacterized protein LOC120817121 isoform X2 [Gasterosteus aculeatus]